MKPLVRNLAKKLSKQIYDTLKETGVDVSVDGKFCPACGEKMTAACLVLGGQMKHGSSLWLCLDCAEVLRSYQLVSTAHEVARLSLKEKMALCFHGKVPKTWIAKLKENK